MTIQFAYDKRQVIQGLRYHFISRPEIKTVLIVVECLCPPVDRTLCTGKNNSAGFYHEFDALDCARRSVSGLSCRVWFTGVRNVPARFIMHFDPGQFTLEHEHGSRSWPGPRCPSLSRARFFHLYFDSRTFSWYPKAVVPVPEELSELRKMLTEENQEEIAGALQLFSIT